MVAITTDTHRHLPPFVAPAPRGRALPAHPGPRPAGGGQPAAPVSSVARLLAVVLAVVVVLAVAVGTAALGRVLDAQRGIPVSASAPAAPAD